jgi:hypothetical protein
VSRSIARNPIQFQSVTATLPYALLAVAFVGYVLARKVFLAASISPWLGLVVVLVSMACALPFVRVRYDELPPFLGFFVRGIGIVVLVQVLFDCVNLAPGSPNLFFGVGDTAIFYRYGALIALLAGLLGLRRPAFLVPLFGYYAIFRMLIGVDTGINVVHTDYASMLDTGLFGIVGGLVAVTATSRWTLARFDWLARFGSTGDPARLRIEACLLIWAGAVGAHLGNYLYSGIAKIQAGGPEPLTWLFHNVTQTSILMGLERGDNPLSAWPNVLQGIWDMFATFALPLNALVLGGQLLAPAAILHRRVLLALTVFYDLFHIGVYLTLGALFLFWIVVNFLVFVTAQKLPARNLTNGMRIIMLLAIVFGDRYFYTNHLGWLDGAKISSPRFFAQDRDGKSAPIPGPYFGIFAYDVAMGRLYLPNNAFPMRIGGNTVGLADWRDAQECGPMRLATQDTGVTLDAVDSLVVSTDQFAREHPWYKAWNTYYYYPHHMVSNPFDFTAFNSMKIEDIVAYTYVVDSVCLRLENGRLVRDVRDHWEFKIPVPATQNVGSSQRGELFRRAQRQRDRDP